MRWCWPPGTCPVRCRTRAKRCGACSMIRSSAHRCRRPDCPTESRRRTNLRIRRPSRRPLSPSRHLPDPVSRMAETHVIEYELTEEMADAAANAVIASTGRGATVGRLRRLLIQLGIYGLIALGAVVIGIETDQPWWFYVAPVAMLALSVLVLGGMGLAYVFGGGQQKHLENALREGIRGLDSRHVRWTVTDGTLTVQSGKDIRVIRWANVQELTLTGTFWLLTATGSPTMLLSGERVPEDTARFILKCAQQAGTRIRVAGATKGNSDGASRADFP